VQEADEIVRMELEAPSARAMFGAVHGQIAIDASFFQVHAVRVAARIGNHHQPSGQPPMLSGVTGFQA
jgi:hypothetical protein